MFVLCQQASCVELFWTGLVTDDGSPDSTTNLDDAAQFCSADSAARCASPHKQLDDWTVAERFAPSGRRR